jgi:hypothetical protein
LTGRDASRWRTGLPTYEGVVYRNLWPGIDLAFRGDGGDLKYEFRLAPGANPDDIRLAYRGAERLSLGADGELRIHTSLGVLRDDSPESYQTIDGERVPVVSRYVLAGRGYRFALGEYDSKRPLVIDPGLEYSTARPVTYAAPELSLPNSSAIIAVRHRCPPTTLVSAAGMSDSVAGGPTTHAPGASVATDANGQAVFCYTGPEFPGADDIKALADTDGDGVIDPGEPIASATNTWLLPDATPGHVTGGGQAPARGDAAEIAFGFNAKSDDDRINGNCNVVDQAADIQLKCVEITSLVRDGTHATIFGNATINEAATLFRIDVDDQDESGGGRDSFRIVTSNGYATGGVLSRGNIQVR